MKPFVSWLDRPFNPRHFAEPMRPGGRFVTIRYSGSFGRSAVKVLVVLALLAAMSSIIGEKSVQDLAAVEASYTIGAVAPGR